MKAFRVTAAVACVAIGLATFTSRASGDGASVLQPTAEAWFQPDPTCGTPLGCSRVTPPPLSPYPQNTLHVSVSGAQETARTFIAFALRNLGGTISAATLTLPLDTKALNGDTNSATAHLAVCLTNDPITPAAGSFGPRPGTDCSSAAAASYKATPTPHFAADLSPLLDRLAAATGVVILPDATKLAPGETWRVAFSSHDRSDAGAPPAASLAVSVSNDVETPYEDDTLFVPDLNVSLSDPPVGTGFAPRSPSETTITSTPRRTETALPPRQIANVGYRYTAMWLLPLLLVALAPTIVQALTKDLTPPGD